jgi:hypothetical protein
MAKITYYPGNVARAGASEIEDMIQPLCRALNIQLVELPRSSSDGGKHHQAGLLLNFRTHWLRATLLLPRTKDLMS